MRNSPNPKPSPQDAKQARETETAVLELVRPSEQYLVSYLEACRETWGHVHDSYILHDPDKFDEWRGRIFSDFADHEKGVNLPDGHMPSATFWLVEGNEFVGTVNIRLKMNEFLSTFGGRFGIFVRMSRRHSGIATRANPMIIQKTRELGIVGDILIICRENNVPSVRVLMNSSYKSMETATVLKDGIPVRVRRFLF